MIDLQEIGKRLKIERKKMGLTLDEVASKLSLTKSAISSWENGNSKISIENLHALAEHLKLDLHWLVVGQKKEAPLTEASEAYTEMSMLLGRTLAENKKLKEQIAELRKQA